jgi:hypothetical protein
MTISEIVMAEHPAFEPSDILTAAMVVGREHCLEIASWSDEGLAAAEVVLGVQHFGPTARITQIQDLIVVLSERSVLLWGMK